VLSSHLSTAAALTVYDQIAPVVGINFTAIITRVASELRTDRDDGEELIIMRRRVGTENARIDDFPTHAQISVVIDRQNRSPSTESVFAK
jgi:hypothetical protein